MIIHKKLIFMQAHKSKHDEAVIGYTVIKRSVTIYCKKFKSEENKGCRKLNEKQ